jgi:hypothetical protein
MGLNGLNRWGIRIAVFLVALLASAAWSQTPEQGTVALSGETLLRFRATADGKSPGERANAVYERLPTLLSGQIKESDIRLKQKGDAVQILVRGRLLATLVEGDAAPNRMTTRAYARQVGRHLATVLPRLASRPERLQQMMKARPRPRTTPKPTPRPRRTRRP